MYHQLLDSAPQSKRIACLSRPGVTLIELTVVIVVLLVLIGVSMYSVSGYRDWKRQSEAETVLRMVYTAQRTYLAEHPTEAVDTLLDTVGTDAAPTLINYLSDGSGALPVPKGLNDEDLLINVKVSPPVFKNDPSGATDDGEWDLGG